jgi:osmotically-inducible protein OsmY
VRSALIGFTCHLYIIKRTENVYHYFPYLRLLIEKHKLMYKFLSCQSSRENATLSLVIFSLIHHFLCKRSDTMQKTTAISEMLKFHFGSKVICSDGEAGSLTHVGFDRASRCIAHIGVKVGRFFGKTVYLPFNTVLDSTSAGVTLSLTLADLALSSHEAPGCALFDHRSVVQLDNSGKRGTVFLVAVHPKSGELDYLVAHHLRPNMDTMVQQAYVTQIDSGRFVATIPDAVLEALAPYRPDSELQQEVEQVLHDITPLHVDLPAMHVRVLDSVLYLDGNISSSLRADMVRDQAMGVQGLLEIKNNLIGDDTLAGQIATELAHHPQTRGLPIGVYPKLGVVRLGGAVHNEQQKAVAEEIASKIPGVRSVINTLVVNPKASMLNIMSPAEGGEAADIVPGKYVRHTK